MSGFAASVPGVPVAERGKTVVAADGVGIVDRKEVSIILRFSDAGGGNFELDIFDSEWRPFSGVVTVSISSLSFAVRMMEIGSIAEAMGYEKKR